MSKRVRTKWPLNALLAFLFAAFVLSTLGFAYVWRFGDLQDPKTQQFVEWLRDISTNAFIALLAALIAISLSEPVD